MAAGDYKFIPLVRYGEARNPETFDCADSFIEVLPANVGYPTLEKAGLHRLHLRVTGNNAASAELDCEVWIDSVGQLQFVEHSGDRLIPLREAARRAYEHTRGTDLADMAERHDGAPEGVLEYYALLMMEHHPIFVKKPPSGVIEGYPQELRNKMSFCDRLSGIRYHGSKAPTFVEPLIREGELMLFLEWTDQYRQDKPKLDSKV